MNAFIKSYDASEKKKNTTQTTTTATKQCCFDSLITQWKSLTPLPAKTGQTLAEAYQSLYMHLYAFVLGEAM